MIVALSNPSARQKVRAALSREDPENRVYHPHLVVSWSAVKQLVAKGRNGISILDPYLEGDFAWNELSELRRFSPALSLVCYSDFAGRSAAEILKLAELKPVEVLTFGIDDSPARLASALRRLPQMTRLEGLMPELWERCDPLLDRVLQMALLSGRSVTVAELVSVNGGSRKTLERRLQALGFPTPRTLIMWGRILNAVRLLENSRRSLEDVAEASGFSDAAGMRSAFVRYVSHGPSVFRPEGSLEVAVRNFKAAIT